MPRYWLMKSEPASFSIQDLEAAPDRRTMWDGVRNYQARNFLRDAMAVGDGVLFYHSNIATPAIVGVAEVIRSGYPDPTALDPSNPQYDPKSSAANPLWFVVDIQHRFTARTPLTRADLKAHPVLSEMDVLRRGNRLSVQLVDEIHWNLILPLLTP